MNLAGGIQEWGIRLDPHEHPDRPPVWYRAQTPTKALERWLQDPTARLSVSNRGPEGFRAEVLHRDGRVMLTATVTGPPCPIPEVADYIIQRRDP